MKTYKQLLREVKNPWKKDPNDDQLITTKFKGFEIDLWIDSTSGDFWEKPVWGYAVKKGSIVKFKNQGKKLDVVKNELEKKIGFALFEAPFDQFGAHFGG